MTDLTQTLKGFGLKIQCNRPTALEAIEWDCIVLGSRLVVGVSQTNIC